MSKIDSRVGGLVSTADTTGTLQIQTNSVNAINVDGTQRVSTPNTINVPNTFGFKNRIINGAMVIYQRNDGASVTPIDKQYVVDRFKYGVSQASKLTSQQNAGSVTPPTGFTKYLGTTVGASANVTIGAGDFFNIAQTIEGYNIADLGWGTANAKTVTLSFQVYSSLTGTFGGSIINNLANRSYPFTYTVSSANTWTPISFTIAGDTSGTWTTDNTSGMTIYWSLGTGSTYNGPAGSWAGAFYLSATGANTPITTNGATFYITGVQLEVGTQATSFDFRSIGTELALCQRYYENGSSFSTGYANGGSVYVTYPVQFSVSKRASPTMDYKNNSLVNLSGYGADTSTINGFRDFMVSFADGMVQNNLLWVATSEL